MIFFEWQKERMYLIVSNSFFIYTYIFYIIRCIAYHISIHLIDAQTHTYTISLFTFKNIRVEIKTKILHKFRFCFYFSCPFQLEKLRTICFPFGHFLIPHHFNMHFFLLYFHSTTTTGVSGLVSGFNPFSQILPTCNSQGYSPSPLVTSSK